jgi:hypothetical protein
LVARWLNDALRTLDLPPGKENKDYCRVVHAPFEFNFPEYAAFEKEFIDTKRTKQLNILQTKIAEF